MNEAIRDTMIEACKENLKKIKEKENEPLRKLKNQITEYDEKIRDLEHAQKNKQTWKMNLVKEKKKLEQHIILIAEKNSQLLELLKSIEHLIP